MEESKGGDARAGLDASAAMSAHAEDGSPENEREPPRKKPKTSESCTPAVVFPQPGVSSFEEIRRRGLPYVDKTRFAARLAEEGSCKTFFRPRRFGKTLLMDTTQCYLERREDLFRGLDVHNDRMISFAAEQEAAKANGLAVPEEDPFWAEENSVPVVRIDLSQPAVGRGPRVFEMSLAQELRLNARRLSVEEGIREHYDDLKQDRGGSINVLFKALLLAVEETHGKRAAVLIDEIDAPIAKALDANGQQMNERVSAIRDILHDFVLVTKSCRDNTHMQLVTGVVHFIISDMASRANHFTHGSFEDGVAFACGFTPEEIGKAFGPQLDALATARGEIMTREAVLSEMEAMHSGWCFAGAGGVLNPWDVLKSLQLSRVEPFWIGEGVASWVKRLIVIDPTLSLDIMNGAASVTRNVPGLLVDRELFKALVAEHPAPKASVLRVLLETGLLAVKRVEDPGVLVLRHVNPTIEAFMADIIFPGLRSGLDASPAREALAKAYMDRSIPKLMHAADGALKYTAYPQWTAKTAEHMVQATHTVAMGMVPVKFLPEAILRAGRSDFIISFRDGSLAFVEYKVVHAGATAAKINSTARDAVEQVLEYSEEYPGSEPMTCWVAVFSVKGGKLLLVLSAEEAAALGGVESSTAPEEVDTEDIDMLTVKQLKGQLKERGLPVGGLKADLQERLRDAVRDASCTAAEELDMEHIDTLTVTQLKSQLKKRGLPLTGRKANLQERLREVVRGAET